MSSETTMVSERCRLQEWAAQIRECQRRPAGMSIVSWCACHGITKANYYHWLRRVREAPAKLKFQHRLFCHLPRCRQSTMPPHRLFPPPCRMTKYPALALQFLAGWSTRRKT